jgi:ABC-type antimicrobial peptide transport system permease subunit
MIWLIFIHSYLWRNSLRRWWEQPLSLLSKLVVAGLLGLFGALFILGLKSLGEQLDRRLLDRETLAVLISETFSREYVLDGLEAEANREDPWHSLGAQVTVFLQAAASAVFEGGSRVPVVAVPTPEQHGLVDDFYLYTTTIKEGTALEFQIGKQRSEAFSRPPSADAQILFKSRDVLIGGADRMSSVLMNGFTKTSILYARSLDEVQTVHDMADVLFRVEGRRVVVQSNLAILREIEKIRIFQARALTMVTLCSSLVLGLVFGSLAWMEFREERYLLALIRSFGVGRWTLLLHALMENCLLAIGGVLLGFAILQLGATRMDLDGVGLSWLRQTHSLHDGEGLWLIIGAALGGLLACVPVAIGLRKPLGLVLK